MSHQEPAEPAVLDGIEERVLLSVAADHDREFLSDRLGDRYAVIEGDPAEVENVDLCIIDVSTYRRVESALVDAKRETDAHLPVLLLLEDQGRAREAEWLEETVGETVDDVLVLPAPPHALDARVETLLRVRRQSLQLSLFRRAMDEATIGISITDPNRPDNPLVYVNEGFCRLTGYDREEVLGRNCRLLHAPDTDGETAADVRAAIDAEEPTTVEIRNSRADGEPFWNLLTVAPIRDADGELTHFLGFQRDVTEQEDLRTELRAERELLERVFETSPVAIVTHDATGEIIRANQAAGEELGLDRADIVSRAYDDPAWEHLDEHGESIPAEDLPVARVLRTGDPVEDYGHKIRVDGEERWISANAAPVTDDGEVEAVVVAVEDITERLERERELERASTVLETMKDGVWIVDDDRRLSYVNSTITDELPLETADIVGTPVESFRHLYEDEDDFERYIAAIDDILAGRAEDAAVDMTFSLPDRSIVVNLRMAPIRGDDEVSGVVVVSNDITERVERERELERYEAIVETTSDPISVLDPDGYFVRVNDAMVEVSGYDREELVGSHASLVAEERTVEEAEGYIRDLLEEDRDQVEFEAQMVFRGGIRREFVASLAILRDDDGEFRGTVIVAHDITDLHRSQRRLSVLDRVLRHNLRNRMNVVLGYATELETHPDQEVARIGGAIEDSARNLLELSEEARAFEPAIVGEAQATTPMDVTEVVATAVDEASDAYPDVDLSVDLPDGAPIGGHETFRLAVTEVIENAIEHNPRDTSTVRVGVRTLTDRVEISVADDGPGIDAIERRALAAGTESSLQHSQGLGLWLVNWAVRSIGGDLRIEDNEPSGTVVTISVPRADE
jgi:PAS domain S-box-containing protein